MFSNKRQESPWNCSRCGSHNVVLRDIRLGIRLLDKLADLFGGSGDPRRQRGAKRIICKDCGYISFIQIM